MWHVFRLTCFHADFGKEFASRTLCRGPSQDLKPLSKLCAMPIALRSRALLEGKRGRKSAKKKRGRGVASKGDAREKVRAKTSQSTTAIREIGSETSA